MDNLEREIKPGQNMWVAVGRLSNSIAYSYDGIHWTELGSSLPIHDSSEGSRLEWTDVGGSGGSRTNTIAYSYDGIHWTELGSSIFSLYGRRVAWNGRMWVAVGGADAPASNSIAYSYDGIHWTGLANKYIFGRAAYGPRGVAWNGRMWVAVGNGTNTIAYSYDGIHWTGLGTSTFSSYGSGSRMEWTDVGGGGLQWAEAPGILSPIVMMGFIGTPGSYGGIDWWGLGTSIFTTGRGVAWNGRMWVAVGEGTTGTIAYSYEGGFDSYDGINWTGLGLSIFYDGGMGSHGMDGCGWQGGMGPIPSPPIVMMAFIGRDWD